MEEPYRRNELWYLAEGLQQYGDGRILSSAYLSGIQRVSSQEELCAFLDERPAGLEVVLTGHSLPEALERRADYITHMVKEKHPYDRGVTARREIEF